ncbi:hypothetical protein WBU96_28545 [Bacillus albus]|uniref:hypothetical protein n=1 Tax=Bacillus albus TaxID=2026189 RepID=UPI003014C7A0
MREYAINRILGERDVVKRTFVADEFGLRPITLKDTIVVFEIGAPNNTQLINKRFSTKQWHEIKKRGFVTVG